MACSVASRRDYRAEYRRRTQRAQALGYRNYADQRRRRREGRPLPVDTDAETPRAIDTPAGRSAENRWTIIPETGPRRPDGRGRNQSNVQVLAAADRAKGLRRRPGKPRDELGHAITIRAAIDRPSDRRRRHVLVGGHSGIDARTIVAKGGPGPERGARGAGVRGIVATIGEVYELDEFFDGFHIGWIARVDLTIA